MHLIVIVDALDSSSRNAITAGIRSEGVSWWHHFRHAWLIVDKKHRTPAWWRDKLHKAAPEGRILVLKSEPAAWAGVLKEADARWVLNTWRGSE